VFSAAGVTARATLCSRDHGGCLTVGGASDDHELTITLGGLADGQGGTQTLDGATAQHAGSPL
jgi:hypothetical protein